VPGKLVGGNALMGPPTVTKSKFAEFLSHGGGGRFLSGDALTAFYRLLVKTQEDVGQANQECKWGMGWAVREVAE